MKQGKIVRGLRVGDRVGVDCPDGYFESTVVGLPGEQGVRVDGYPLTVHCVNVAKLLDGESLVDEVER